MDLVGEAVAVSRILGFCVLLSFHFRTFLLTAWDDHSLMRVSDDT